MRGEEMITTFFTSKNPKFKCQSLNIIPLIIADQLINFSYSLREGGVSGEWENLTISGISNRAIILNMHLLKFILSTPTLPSRVREGVQFAHHTKENRLNSLFCSI